jgi:choline monooxygenase
LIHADPLGPAGTRETTYLLIHPESASDARSEEAVDRLAAFWDEVNREDIEIVERVQQGLATTPFPGGRLCYRFEEPLHRFQNMIIDRMVGVWRVPPGDEAESSPMFAPQDAGAPAGWER